LSIITIHGRAVIRPRGKTGPRTASSIGTAVGERGSVVEVDVAVAGRGVSVAVGCGVSVVVGCGVFVAGTGDAVDVGVLDGIDVGATVDSAGTVVASGCGGFVGASAISGGALEQAARSSSRSRQLSWRREQRDNMDVSVVRPFPRAGQRGGSVGSA